MIDPGWLLIAYMPGLLFAFCFCWNREKQGFKPIATSIVGLFYFVFTVCYFYTYRDWLTEAFGRVVTVLPIAIGIPLFCYGLLLVEKNKYHKRLFKPKEVRAILKIVNKEEKKYSTPAFKAVSVELQNLLDTNKQYIVSSIKNGTTPEELAHSLLAKSARQCLESKDSHLYRGILNPLSDAKALLSIFDSSINSLVSYGKITKEESEEEKKALRQFIKSTG